MLTLVHTAIPFFRLALCIFHEETHHYRTYTLYHTGQHYILSNHLSSIGGSTDLHKLPRNIHTLTNLKNGKRERAVKVSNSLDPLVNRGLFVLDSLLQTAPEPGLATHSSWGPDVPVAPSMAPGAQTLPSRRHSSLSPNVTRCR